MNEMKILRHFPVAVAALCMLLFAASCGEEEIGAPKVDGPKDAVMNCSLETDDVTLTKIDFYVKYIDAKGQVQTEKNPFKTGKNSDGETVQMWSKEVVVSLPGKLGMDIELKAKDGVDMAAACQVNYSYFCEFTSRNASEIPIETKPFSKGGASSIKAGAFQDYLSRYGHPLSEVFSFDAQGRMSTSTW